MPPPPALPLLILLFFESDPPVDWASEWPRDKFKCHLPSHGSGWLGFFVSVVWRGLLVFAGREGWLSWVPGGCLCFTVKMTLTVLWLHAFLWAHWVEELQTPGGPALDLGWSSAPWVSSVPKASLHLPPVICSQFAPLLFVFSSTSFSFHFCLECKHLYCLFFS